MYCARCGRVFRETYCKKCKMEIPEENKIIPYKKRPSVIFNLIAFTCFVPFLLIELFVKQKTPKDRAGIECAKKAFWYLFIILVLGIGSYFGQMYISDMFIWLRYTARFLTYGSIIYMIIVVIAEKNGAEKVYDENGLEVSTKD